MSKMPLENGLWNIHTNSHVKGNGDKFKLNLYKLQYLFSYFLNVW